MATITFALLPKPSEYLVDPVHNTITLNIDPRTITAQIIEGDPLILRLTRNVSLTTPLVVELELTGTAILGEDFESATTVRFAPGQSTADLEIYPINQSTGISFFDN